MMRYLLVQTQDGYWERPVKDDRWDDCGSLWRIKDGKEVFYLDGETHVFDRGEDVTVSSGPEADILIPVLESRLYIRNMQVFFEAAAEEHLYLNQGRLGPGDFQLCPGDILFLKYIKLEVWEDRISIQGSQELYRTVLFERHLPERPFDSFPVYKRSPRLVKRLSEERILMELPKGEERQDKKGLLMTVLPPLGMTAVTTAVGFLIGRGVYMLMSVSATGMTAVFSGIRYLRDKRELTEKNKGKEKRYIAYMWSKQKELARAYVNEWEVYQYQYPDTDRICRMVKEYDSRIYERVPSDDDFLTVVIGHGRGGTSFRIECRERGWDDEEDRLTGTLRELGQKFSVIDKPKIIDLKKANLGMAGEKEVLHQQIRIIAAQAAFFQSYHDLQMIVVYDERYEEEFSWMRWLPHMRIEALNVLGMVHSERTRDIVLGSMSRILKGRAARLEEGKKDSRFYPHYLFIIDEPSLIMGHAVMEYLCMEGQKMGFSMIYTSHERTNLPEYARTVLLLENSREGLLLLEEKVYKNQKIELYQAQKAKLEWMARDLSVLEHEQGITGCIPKNVTFFQMYKVRHPEELGIRQRWKRGQSHKSLAVPLGMRSEGDVMYLNLHEKAHGPHGLVAGMTGSGKSELIQTYILSLAVNFHPHEVGFLLIDYKGGGMANLFQGLPHHLGTITNLDMGGSMRALASVKAELLRRQRMFVSYGVNHINGYMQLFKEGTAKEPVPHLFIISDEFAELKREQPDFMKELVSAARIGRSLGVHLILATQKPAGVVDEQIWSNSRFRMCLKVQDESDSREILRTPDAADITLPGRAYLQVGNNEIYEMFQSALSSAVYVRGGEECITDDRIYVINELGQGELVNQDLSGGRKENFGAGTQLEAVVEHIRKICESEVYVKVKKPWLLPLPEMLVSPYVDENGEMTWLSGKRSQELPAVCIGKIDIPEQQKQEDFTHSFVRDGNLLFVASPGFGKTVFLTTLLVSLALLRDVDDMNFYILDYGNSGLMPLKELPHTAEYISLDDSERYWKFKKLMTEEMAARKKMLARYAAPSAGVYGELSGTPLKTIIVAVDQFDAVRESGIEEEEFFTKLSRDGAGLGIYMAVAATRMNAIRQATLNNFKTRLAGYNYDENEAFLMVGRSGYRQSEIRGRAFVNDENVHAVQLCVMAPCTHDMAYIKALKRLVREIKRLYPGKEAPHIPVLPEELYADMLKNYENTGNDYLVGLDVEEVTGKGFDRCAGPFIIIGNAGSGKTNMARVLASQATSRGRTYIFDAKGMELYYYRGKQNVLYIEDREEAAVFRKEIAEEIDRRRLLVKRQLEECPDKNPRTIMGEMPFCTVLIDDVDDFTELMKENLEQTAQLLKEGCALGITCIITVHAARARGMDEVNKMVKQAADGLVLSAQGLMPIFPVPGMRELPEHGDGLLFRNGVYRRVRLPEAV